MSPSSFRDIKNKEDLKNKVNALREMSGGKPIGVKIAAGHIEKDLEVICYARPDFITIDGRGGSTGSSPKFIKDSSSIPTIYALARARQFLTKNGISGITLIITGGLRVSSDFAKAIALGADVVAIATAALMAAGCQQYRICHSGKCPVGIATQDEELRRRFNIELSSKMVENFLRISTEELKEFARIAGKNDIHLLSRDDIVTTSSDIAKYTCIRHAGESEI